MPMNTNTSATATQTENTNTSVATRVLELYDLATKDPATFTSLVNLSGANNQKLDDSTINCNTSLAKNQSFGDFADFNSWGNFSSWIAE